MNGIMKALLIGGGGYLAWQTGLLSSLTGGLIPAPASSGVPAGTTSSTPPASPANPTSPSPTNPTSAPPAAVPTWQLVQNLAQTSLPTAGTPLLLTFDQWNYFYQNITGIPGPGPDSIPAIGPASSATRGTLLQVGQWWAYMQQLKPGISGLGIVAYRPRGFRGVFNNGGMGGVFNNGGMGGFQPATSSYCGPVDPINGMQPPVDSLVPSPGNCNSGMGRLRWIY